MNGYKALAIGIGVVTSCALAVTTAIIHEAGASQAASESILLAYAAIVSHVGGFVAFGLLAGYHSANGNNAKAWGCRFITLLAAIFTGWQVLTYTTAQVATQNFTRQLAEQREDAKFKAELANDAKRLELQGKLAADQLKATQSMAKGADGRREKKDALEEGRKLIADVGKLETRMPVPMPPGPAPTQTQLRLDTFPAYVAQITGANPAAMQAAPWLLLVIVMMLIEMKGWPECARCWQYGAMASAAAKAAASAAPEPDPLKPTVLVEEPIRKALPPPRLGRGAKVITVRATPTGEWRKLLDDLDFPPNGARHKGPRRPKDQRDHAAIRFLTWLGAYGESGDYTETEIDELYAECCAMDHREQWKMRTVIYPGLEALGKRIAQRWKGPKGKMFTINPPPIDRLTVMLQKRGLLTVAVPDGVILFPPAKKTSGDAA